MSSERAFKGVVAWELVSGVVFCIMLPGVAFLATKAALDQHKMTMTFYGSVLVVVTICCSLNFGMALNLQRQRKHFDLQMNEIRFSRIVESSQNKVRPKKNTRRQSF
jgi:ammonia channel protein AmtB